jgi:hypothetical protein
VHDNGSPASRPKSETGCWHAHVMETQPCGMFTSLGWPRLGRSEAVVLPKHNARPEQGDVDDQTDLHAEEPMVCMTRRWRGVDSNLQFRARYERFEAVFVTSECTIIGYLKSGSAG